MLLCYVTDRSQLRPPLTTEELLPVIQRAVAAGLDWIQIREKNLPASEMLELARRVVTISGSKARVLVNDRLDVALAAGADGVHLGSESFPAREALRWCRAGNAGAGFLVGVSCHRMHEAIEAADAGADYIFFGPVFETPAKLRFGPPQGVERLAEVCQRARTTVFAIGGIDESNAGECLRAGAAGLAAIRLFQQHLENLAATVRKLRSLGSAPVRE